jgi:hypothetical protein
MPLIPLPRPHQKERLIEYADRRKALYSARYGLSTYYYRKIKKCEALSLGENDFKVRLNDREENARVIGLSPRTISITSLPCGYIQSCRLPINLCSQRPLALK